MPINEQGVLTRLEGSGEEADSPLSKAAEILSSYILQVLETSFCAWKLPPSSLGLGRALAGVNFVQGS